MGAVSVRLPNLMGVRQPSLPARPRSPISCRRSGSNRRISAAVDADGGTITAKITSPLASGLEPEPLDAAQVLLEWLSGEHGLSQLCHGAEFVEVLAVFADGRTRFDVVRFGDVVAGRLGRCPGVVSATPPGTCPGRPVGATRWP